MLKKLGIKTAVAGITEVATEDQYLGLSGSDLEAVLVRAILEAESSDSSEVKAEHLQKAFTDFIPPANSREREMQILVAVLESTSRELLPERFRTLDRGEVQARVNEIKRDLRLI
jgi:SpoVK/Ycf46/Vps4 family AAA+-type ATPase